jgi:anaerobic selenocysteine-containing dehydrogenase
MGFDDPCFADSDDDMIRTLLDSAHPFINGITLEELDRDGSVRLRLPQPFQPFSEGGFGTADGKCQFHAETLDYTPPIESRHGDRQLNAKFPLEMISPKNDDSMNSTFGNRPAVDRQTALLHMTASDAARRGIADADQVRVWNDRGSLLLVARVDDSVRSGVVCTPAVRWGKTAPGGRNANALTSERLTDAGGGATFYSCLVEVERIGD